jgi:hypothetical protein
MGWNSVGNLQHLTTCLYHFPPHGVKERIRTSKRNSLTGTQGKNMILPSFQVNAFLPAVFALCPGVESCLSVCLHKFGDALPSKWHRTRDVQKLPDRVKR